MPFSQPHNIVFFGIFQTGGDLSTQSLRDHIRANASKSPRPVQKQHKIRPSRQRRTGKTKKADKISSVRRKTLPEGRTSSIIYLRIKNFLYGVMQPLKLDGTADKRYPDYQESYPQKDGDHLGTE